MNEPRTGLYDPTRESSACGVGFITRKDGTQHHDVIAYGEHALCAIPHRGGMSSEDVGDGGGVSMDLSLAFFRKVTGRSDLQLGRFCVGNFFLPQTPKAAAHAARLIESTMTDRGFTVLTVRDVPVDDVRAAFFYVRSGETVAPSDLLEHQGLADLITSAGEG